MTKDYLDPFAFTKQLIPASVGFDTLFKSLSDMHRTLGRPVDGYPPYNIKKIDENKYVIEVAVAGFGKSDIEITIQEGTLTIKGLSQSQALAPNMSWLYKGIADRGFTRQFQLADTVEIKNAELFNGMLKVYLESMIPEAKKARKIEINAAEEHLPAESTEQFLTEKYEK